MRTLRLESRAREAQSSCSNYLKAKRRKKREGEEVVKGEGDGIYRGKNGRKIN